MEKSISILIADSGEQYEVSRYISDKTPPKAAAAFGGGEVRAMPLPEISPKIDEKIKLEKTVTQCMLELGIPAHVKGYQYIRTAIMMAVEDTAPLTYITKQLYPDIAKLHRTVASCVERSIRTAIELAWNRGSRSKIYEIFGCSVNNKKGKPSNSEFIAMVADHIRLNYGNLNNFPSDI